MNTVTFDFKNISVKATGKTKAEILANAKKELLKQMEMKFPSFTYMISDGEVLTIDTAQPGMIVEGDGNIGIVTGVNPKTINVTYTGARSVSGHPELFKKSDATFEKARSRRYPFMIQNNDWGEGDTGYIKTKDGILEVVVGKGRGKKKPFYVINGEGTHYKIDESQYHLIKDELKDIK